MVQMTGNYIWYNGRYRQTLTYKDGPLKLDPGLEARLVKEGTARYIEVPVEDEPLPKPAQEESKQELTDMTVKELRAYAKEIGVEKVNSYSRKADLIDAIQAEEESVVGDV